MKKKTLANIIMVSIILVIVVVGVVLGAYLRNTGGTEAVLGSLFSEKLIRSSTDGTTCTLTIACDTILDHTDRLDPAKAPYVPKDGYILKETTVSFTEGETVFDVLQRICEEGNIQLEYSWTPLHDSYYVEGISHIYEFDCGNESGWMYKVNDTFPNYGCSSYEVQSGDSILWRYTCVGYGADIGANMEN